MLIGEKILAEFKIDGIPPTYNTHFNIQWRTHQIYLSKEAKNYKRFVKLSCPPAIIPKGILLSLYVEICSSKWWTKKKTVRRIDLMNLDKLLVDAIAEDMGFDDSMIFNSHFRKVVGDEEYTYIKLCEYVEEVKGG